MESRYHDAKHFNKTVGADPYYYYVFKVRCLMDNGVDYEKTVIAASCQSAQQAVIGGPKDEGPLVQEIIGVTRMDDAGRVSAILIEDQN